MTHACEISDLAKKANILHKMSFRVNFHPNQISDLSGKVAIVTGFIFKLNSSIFSLRYKFTISSTSI